MMMMTSDWQGMGSNERCGAPLTEQHPAAGALSGGAHPDNDDDYYDYDDDDDDDDDDHDIDNINKNQNERAPRRTSSESIFRPS